MRKIIWGFVFWQRHLSRLQSWPKTNFAKSTLGPLYPPGKEEAPNKVLQENLNDLGSKYKEDDWQELKLDGWIGPKTEEAYSISASIADPTRSPQALGGI